jgi:predicted DNA-binding transcriptional regulator YafY
MSNLHRIQWIDNRIRSSRFPNCTDIANEFCISVRQASRDVEYLKYSLGAPLEYSFEKRGYYYSEPAFVLPSILMTEDEKKALLYLADRYRSFGGEMTTRLASLFEKMGGDVIEKTGIPGSVPIYPLTNKQIEARDLTRQAIGLKTKISIVYVDYGNRKSERIIRPYVTYTRNNVEYVHAFCEKRDAERDFRIDRIQSAKPVNESFIMPVSFDPKNYSENGRFDYRLPYTTTIKFDNPIEEGIFESMQVAESADFKSNYIYTIGFRSSQKLLSTLISLNSDFTIISPRWLRDKFASFFLRILKKNS